MPSHEELREITREAIKRLSVLEESGQGFLYGMKLPKETHSGNAGIETDLDVTMRRTGKSAESGLAELERRAKRCTKCALSKDRKNVVFSDGSTKSGIVFIGEAPGREEDIKGKPFVGEAGKLLTRIIIKGMGLCRDDVYIANVLKCRPPFNRDPDSDEIKACVPILIQQLELVKPKMICALGKFAAQFLTESKEPISALRGKVFSYRGIPVIPTFHPAAILRNPGLKRSVWEDIQLIMKECGIPMPIRGEMVTF
ncbi:MAG: uracil-DNA glycosylase [Candidatus Eisenbacteria bacterium]|nr:uracil-DNA glycosylase [Candidatus Eisenbacteria bacterium]